MENVDNVGWLTIKVFISSTFQDMNSERDYLAKIVFPALREEMLKYYINIIEIDLRWGIPKEGDQEEYNNFKIYNILFNQITQCRPYFISLLGDRYGSVINNIPNRIMNRYQLEEAFIGKSITEQEILYGVLAKPHLFSKAYFYFRDENLLKSIPESVLSIYTEADLHNRIKLQNLKNHIEEYSARHPIRNIKNNAYEVPIYKYQASWNKSKNRLNGLEGFGEKVFNNLYQGIDAEYNLDERLLKIQEQKKKENLWNDQTNYIQSNLSSYVRRDKIEAELINYASSYDSNILLMHGASGSGITTSLSWLYNKIKNNQSKLHLFANFVGSTKQSTNYFQFIGHLCDKLKTITNSDETVETDLLKRVDFFKRHLFKISKDEKLIIIIDGLQLFEETDYLYRFSFLPEQLPPNVRIIIGLNIDDNNNNVITQIKGKTNIVLFEIPLLTRFEAIRMLKKIPLISAKRLDKSQLTALLHNKAIHSPLFLNVALNELRSFGSFELLTSRIRNLPQLEENRKELPFCIRAIFNQVIDRLEEDFDKNIVKDLLTFIVCSKSGISEKILIEESSNTDNSKKEIAITIVRQLRPYLLYLEDKIDIYHEQFKKAISFKYFTNDSFKINQHRRLSKHYHGLGDDLAWHLAESGDLDNLAGLLSGTLYDFGAYWVKNPEAVKEFWRQIGKIKNIDIVHAYSRHINMSESDIFSAINRENLFHIHFNFLSDLFRELGYVEESIKIHKICIRIHGKMGDPTIIDDLLNEARMHIHEHKHDEALSALLRVEPLIREKNIPFLWCAFYNSKANLYIDEGMLSEAVVELDKTYLFSNDSTCSLEIAYTLHLRATTLKIQNRYEEALSLEKQSEVILNNSNASLTNNYVYQAELHFRLGNFKEAVSHFEKAEERLQNGTNFQLLQYVLHCKAVALIKENDLNAAFYNLLEEEDLCRENKLTQELLFCLWEQAVLSSNTDRQDFDRAFDKLIEHKKILSEFNFEDKENLINENNKLMAIVLFNQAIVIWNQLSSFLSREDFRNRCISKMNEAISIAKDVKNFDANELKRMIEFTGAI